MKKIFRKILVLSLLLLLMSSCITGKQKKYLQNDNEQTEYKTMPFEQYRLNVNDELVYYMMTEDLDVQQLYNMGSSMYTTNGNLTYRIYEDGCILLPSIGRVEVAGLTVSEAERRVTERFRAYVVPDAEIKIALANNYFYVQGDGGKGQFYMYKENLNIFQALAMAGDITSMGDKEHVRIIRKGSDGVDYIKTFDLRKASIIGSEYYYVRPNDVIYIPTTSRSFFRIDSMTSFITVIVTPLSLLLMAVSFIDK